MASPEQVFESMPYFWCKKAEQYTIDRTKRIITNRLKKVQNDSKIPLTFKITLHHKHDQTQNPNILDSK